MNIAPASALAAWAVGTAWLILFLILEHFDPHFGEELVDWIQAVIFVGALAFYPLFRKLFAAWLVKRPHDHS